MKACLASLGRLERVPRSLLGFQVIEPLFPQDYRSGAAVILARRSVYHSLKTTISSHIRITSAALQ
ncbi:hypothetical protein [Flavobacterium silvaticum]|uniref:Uncharacterized protein n=1 Tax=Flavobacterium silvaticum TaxID=1852020 RepID=A0A972FJN5_9FLAO|nr:hypothetical protein [Flavobacterium silvaticum]NMH26912.1 hypothetical protein [Flavobacterium silvaticum]